jgi:hypothetical protein
VPRQPLSSQVRSTFPFRRAAQPPNPREKPGLAPPTRRARLRSRRRPRCGGADAGRWREQQRTHGPQRPEESQNRSGFDKRTLAIALIGLMRAGQKPARSPRQLTGHRPLSNPPLRPPEAQPSSPRTALMLKLSFSSLVYFTVSGCCRCRRI